MNTEQKRKFAQEVLSNNESSSNDELVGFFMKEGKFTEQEAKEWVSKRSFYLTHMVMEDGGVFDPKTGGIVYGMLP